MMPMRVALLLLLLPLRARLLLKMQMPIPLLLMYRLKPICSGRLIRFLYVFLREPEIAVIVVRRRRVGVR